MSTKPIARILFRLLGMLLRGLLALIGFLTAWALIISGTIMLKIGTQINKLLR
jgi:hypothetical protein